jgi:3D (Asp-Asp-Asp) domain-containing protein
MVSALRNRLRPALLGLAGCLCLVLATAAAPAAAAAPWPASRASAAASRHCHHHRPYGHPAPTAAVVRGGGGAGSGNVAGSGGATAGTQPRASTGTGTAGIAGTGTAGTFVQGTGSPTITGGLQVGGKIDGLTIRRVVHLVATAYGATAADNYPYGAVDAFGVPLKPGDVAVDPSVIPLNTKLYVTGYTSPYLPRGGELAVARDTGGAIKGSRIDMYVNSTNQSLIDSFGIQRVTAYILGN